MVLGSKQVVVTKIGPYVREVTQCVNEVSTPMCFFVALNFPNLLFL